MEKNNVLSYESSKWYVKLWRTRWYLYAIFLHLIQYINVSIWIDLLLNQELDNDDKKRLRNNGKDIKRHIELSKMYKFSSKTKYEREE